METSTLPTNPVLDADFKRAFEALPQMTAILSVPEFRFLAVTDMFCQVTTYDRSRLLGVPIVDAFPKNPSVNHKNIHKIESSLKQVVRTKKPHNLDIFRFDLPASTDPTSALIERWWRVVNTPVFDKDGTVVYILNTVEDVDNILDALGELEYAAMLRVRGEAEIDPVQ